MFSYISLLLLVLDPLPKHLIAYVLSLVYFTYDIKYETGLLASATPTPVLAVRQALDTKDKGCVREARKPSDAHSTCCRMNTFYFILQGPRCVALHCLPPPSYTSQPVSEARESFVTRPCLRTRKEPSWKVAARSKGISQQRGPTAATAAGCCCCC